ncbi:CPBP family intramembrane glutamic endopeptidase [Ligilactobacillus faecis]|uniref:CPBP family intramembrane glutamic endopeptidase n=1 Tax=Ligilactobacillus faecis TaxID=762833 RepID=UPI0035126066
MGDHACYFYSTFFEEFLCRYLMFSTCRKINMPEWAIWSLSSFLFSLLHSPTNVFDFLSFFFMGFIFCLAYKKYGFSGSVGLHVLNNTISISAMLLMFLR